MSFKDGYDEKAQPLMHVAERGEYKEQNGEEHWKSL